MAALLYSKYHGVVLILLVLLSNLSLLKQPQFYFASIFGALLFFPHLYWQYINDFPSFRYHLSGRDDIYELKYTTTYLLNQLVLFSPFLFPLIVQVLFKTEIKNQLTRAYYYIILGFWAFFFWASFKGHTEPQWTGILSIPLVILTYQFALNRSKFRKWILRLGILTIALLLIARLFMVWNFLGIKSDFHDKDWVATLQEEANGVPIFFENSYRGASKYGFYSQDKVYSFTNVDYRKSQFDLWNWEEDLQNKEALVIVNKLWDCKICQLDTIGRRTAKTLIAKDLQVYSKLEIEFLRSPQQQLSKKTTPELFIKIKNEYPFSVWLDKGNFPLEISTFFLKQGELFAAQKVTLGQGIKEFKPGEMIVKARFQMPDLLKIGQVYQLGMGFNYEGIPPSVSSDLHRVIIKD